MKLLFFGTPEFAVPTLERLLGSRHQVVAVYAQPDRPAGRGMKMQQPPVAQLAAQRGVQLEQPPRIDDEVIGKIAESGAELAVVVAYGRILPNKLLESVPRGFFNVHASLLPKWRGAAPVQRSIAAGETETGVTIMQIDEELDHGPVFAARAIPIGEDERAPSVLAGLSEAGGDLLLDVLDQIEAGTASGTPQNHAEATYAPKVTKEEGNVDWNLPARALYDRFRAFYPWPGLTVGASGERLRLSELSGVSDARGAAGEILSIAPDGVEIASGEGSLVVVSMQRPGRRAAPAADVVRGMRLGIGDRLS